MVPRDLKPVVGALIAQAELGSYRESRLHSQALVYPPYFPDWSEGIAYQISREHKKLVGMMNCAIPLCVLFVRFFLLPLLELVSYTHVFSCTTHHGHVHHLVT